MLSITALLPVLQCSARVDGGVVLPAFMWKGLNLVNLLDKVSAVGLTKKQFLLEPECGVCCGLRYHAAMHRDRRMCPDIYYFGPLDPFGDLQNWALQRWRATLVIFKLDFIISLISHILRSIGLPWSQPGGTTWMSSFKKKQAQIFLCRNVLSRCIFTYPPCPHSRMRPLHCNKSECWAKFTPTSHYPLESGWMDRTGTGKRSE